MDWTRPLATLWPAVHGATLEALWRRSAPMTGREVHRVTRVGSYTGVLAALARLVDQGVVDSRRVGQADVYELNREHVAYPAIDAALSAFQPRADLDDRIRALVAAAPFGPDVRTWVGYFGSFARGEATSESDIDVLLVIDGADDRDREELVDDLQRCGERWTGNAVQVFSTSRADVARALADEDPIVDEWVRDAVPVVGPEFHRVLADLR